MTTTENEVSIDTLCQVGSLTATHSDHGTFDVLAISRLGANMRMFEDDLAGPHGAVSLHGVKNVTVTRGHLDSTLCIEVDAEYGTTRITFFGTAALTLDLGRG